MIIVAHCIELMRTLKNYTKHRNQLYVAMLETFKTFLINNLKLQKKIILIYASSIYTQPPILLQKSVAPDKSHVKTLRHIPLKYLSKEMPLKQNATTLLINHASYL